MRRGGALLLLLAAGCARSEDNAAALADASSVSVAMQSEDAVAGRRPLLTISCGPNGASFWVELVRTPDPPPPPRGSFASIKVDDAPAVRLEIAWLGADRWAPRVGHEEEGALVRAMLAGRNIYFAGPEGTTDRAYRWDMARLGAGAGELRSTCG